MAASLIEVRTRLLFSIKVCRGYRVRTGRYTPRRDGMTFLTQRLIQPFSPASRFPTMSYRHSGRAMPLPHTFLGSTRLNLFTILQPEDSVSQVKCRTSFERSSR